MSINVLKLYRDKKNLTTKEMADLFGVTYTHMYYLITDKRRVSKALAKKIEEITAGEIKAVWLLLPEKYQDSIVSYYIFEN